MLDGFDHMGTNGSGSRTRAHTHTDTHARSVVGLALGLVDAQAVSLVVACASSLASRWVKRAGARTALLLK